jgi:argininosuccinate synthase
MTKRKMVLAFSGGLDTSYALVAMREQGWDVVTATIDTGGLQSEEEDEVRRRAEELGSLKHFVVDAREELYSRVISYAIKANYLRNGGYPSCVGAERLIQAEKVVEVALAEGAEAIAHGSTGAGADHVRSHRRCRSSPRSATSGSSGRPSGTSCARTGSPPATR